MPRPRRETPGPGVLDLRDGLDVVPAGAIDGRLRRVAARLADRLTRVAGPPTAVADHPSGDRPALELRAERLAPRHPRLGADESYELRVAESGATVVAASALGVERAAATIVQLAVESEAGWRIPAVAIDDAPRFAWRGLLLDVCRHWIPVEDVLRTVDGLAATKLSVLHLHLTDDQAFRFESRAHPELHRQGSAGRWYTRDDLSRIVEHAADRGVRVVPEIDVPGHVTSWLLGYPHLGARPGEPVAPRRTFGIAPVALDPTRDDVHDFLAELLAEVVEVFPDAYLHLGGDEVDPRAWDTPAIADHRAAHGIPDVPTLQARFTARLASVLRAYGRTAVVWDEALHPELPADVVVQAWRSPGAVADAVRAGHRVLVSEGWYLDHNLAAAHHHRVDPGATRDQVARRRALLLDDPAHRAIRDLLATTAPDPERVPDEPLTEAHADRILGGEACMWTELVAADHLDARIWPRAVAVAERLWSEPGASPTDDHLGARLDAVAARLEVAEGLRSHLAVEAALARLAPPAILDAMRDLAAAVEPVGWYARHLASFPGVDLPDDLLAAVGAPRRYDVDTPLDRLVDAVPPESSTARRLAVTLDACLADPAPALCGPVAARLAAWASLPDRLGPVIDRTPRLAELAPLVERLGAIATDAVANLAAHRDGATVAPDTARVHQDRLAAAAAPVAELRIAIVEPCTRLARAVAGPAADPGERSGPSGSTWPATDSG